MNIVLIVVATAAAVLLLVAYSDRLFEENRTRVARPRTGLGARRAESAPSSEPNAEGLVWRTLVGASASPTTENPPHPAPPAPRRDTVERVARPAGQFVEIRRAA